ncbi:MAG: sulfocyanin-like copper-binding protein [Acidimicrobiia bacterium]
MTDTTTEEPTPDEIAVEGDIEPAGDAVPAVAPEGPRDDALQTRFLIPLLLPVLAIIAVALYALNISRVFLAGDSTSALIIATLITLAILVGGSVISATPGVRTSSLAMVVALVMVIVVSAGLMALGPSIDTGEEPASAKLPQPSGPPVATVPVEALASILFNADEYATIAGINEIDLTGATGHTLQFRTLDYEGFPLGTITGFPRSGKVELNAGTYYIYCTIPGHEAAGMHANIVVGDAPPPST